MATAALGTWAPGPASTSPGGFTSLQTNTTSGATLTINGIASSPMPGFDFTLTNNNPSTGGDFLAFNGDGPLTVPTTFTVTYDCS